MFLASTPSFHFIGSISSPLWYIFPNPLILTYPSSRLTARWSARKKATYLAAEVEERVESVDWKNPPQKMKQLFSQLHLRNQRRKRINSRLPTNDSSSSAHAHVPMRWTLMMITVTIVMMSPNIFPIWPSLLAAWSTCVSQVSARAW